MTKYSKESLEKLLILIREICADDANEWFKNLLYTPSNDESQRNDFASILRHIKRQHKVKANTFYDKIVDKKLKAQLVSDYIEMLWYQNLNNIERFMIFVFYQMENLLNHYCKVNDCYKTIQSDKSSFRIEFNPKFIVSCHNSFFDERGEKSIEKVSIWAKLVFWTIHSNNVQWESTNHQNFQNLINIRNQNSHRYSALDYAYNLTTITTLTKADFSSLGFYTALLKKISESFINDSPQIRVNQPTATARPKVVGFMDLSTIKKK